MENGDCEKTGKREDFSRNERKGMIHRREYSEYDRKRKDVFKGVGVVALPVG
jgi:hypothetical protein